MDVYPVTAIDRAPRDVLLTVGLVLPADLRGPLDVGRLRDALFRAVREKVPRAAARIVRTRKNPGFELHIPHDLDAEATPVTFSSAIHENQVVPKNAVPPFGTIQVDGVDSHPAIIPEDAAAAIHFRGVDCPITLAGFLKPNRPALHAHVGVYKDAIIIGITFVHMLADAEGAAILFRSWAAATRGELDSIVTSPRDFHPLVPSRLVAAAKEAGEGADPWVENDRSIRLLGLFATIIVVIQYLWTVISGGSQKCVLVRVPKRWVEEQKALANKEVDTTNAKDRPAVTKNDILQAFVAKIMYAARTDSQPENLHAFVDMRPLLSSTIFPPSKPYIGNAIQYYGPPPVSANVLRTESLGETAVRFRRAIQDFRNGPTLARVAYYCKYSDGGKLFLPFGPGEGAGYISSWLQSQLTAIEFVLSEPGKHDESRKVSRPMYVAGHMSNRPGDLGFISCEDGEAYWISWQTGRRRLARSLAALKQGGEVLVCGL